MGLELQGKQASEQRRKKSKIDVMFTINVVKLFY